MAMKDRGTSPGTVVVEVGPDSGAFLTRLPALAAAVGLGGERVMAVTTGEAAGEWDGGLADQPPRVELLRLAGPADLGRLAEAVKTPLLGFVPAGGSVGPPDWSLPFRDGRVAAWPPPCRLPEYRVFHHTEPVTAWVATRADAFAAFAARGWPGPGQGPVCPCDFGMSTGVDWLSAPIPGATPASDAPLDVPGPLTHSSRILAIVPHHRCEEWLDQCLASLRAQTRPLDGIAVLDDGSPEPPSGIVARHPGVSLYRSATNVGPYRLCQEAILTSDVDGYLLQDADDWSAVDRLGRQLDEATRAGADVVGGQELRVFANGRPLAAVCFPADVNRALGPGPDHALLHGTSLIARAAFLRLGGFSTGVRFGADTEFLYRAHYAARIVNVPAFCYFRRQRAESLSLSPETGKYSPERQRYRDAITRKALANAERHARGDAPDLAPLFPGTRIPLEHLAGPAVLATTAGTSNDATLRPASPRSHLD
jgi:hypothetical protein